MPYVQPRGRKRKLKVFRLLALILIVVALVGGSIWTYVTFFKSTPEEKPEPDPVVTEMEGTYVRPVVTITDPFVYVNTRLESVEINGKVTDLKALYAKYGPYDYYLAEPISEEELNAQFLEIYLFLRPIYQEMLTRDYSVEKRIDMFGHEYDDAQLYYQINGEFFQGMMAYADKMVASTDLTFARYKTSFIYDDIRKYTMYKEPEHVYLRMQGKDAFITRYDRQVFVRMFKVTAIMMQELYAKHGITYHCTICAVPEDN